MIGIMAKNTQTTPPWLADDPTTNDELDRKTFVGAIEAVLRRVQIQSLSSVLALVGPWGSGKSTILQMLSAKLGSQVDSGSGVPWVVAEFNPWTYSGAESLQAGFFAELRDAFPEDDKWKDARSSISRLGKVVTPIAALAGLIGVDGSSVVGALFDEATAFSASKAKKQIEAALVKLQTPVLVVLDDLDRLTSDELLQVFKLVRLVGRLPHVYYLLSYDEQTLIDLLDNTDLIGGQRKRRALDYLEKIVQVRLDLPPLRDYQVDEIVERSVLDLVALHSLSYTADDRSRFQRTFEDVLRDHFLTIRSIRRFFGQVDAFLPSIVGEMDFVDFMLLTWFRINEPGVYALVHAHKSEVLGLRGLSLRRLTAEDPDAARARWAEMLIRAGVAEYQVDEVFYLLGTLFPAVKRIDDAGKSRGTIAEAKPARVANPDYFDRYFAFGVPVEDLPDSIVAEGLRQLAAGQKQEAFALVDAAARANTARTIRKVAAYLAEQPINFERGVDWLRDIYTDVSTAEGPFWIAQDRIEALLSQMFVSSPESAERAAVALSNTDFGLKLVASTVQLLVAARYGSVAAVASENELGARLMPVVSTLICNRFESYKTTEPLELPDEVWYLVWPWSAFNYSEMRKFFDAQLSHGRWGILDTLARLVSTSLSYQGGPPSIAGFEYETVNAFVDVRQAIGALDTEIASSTADADDFRNTVASKTARREYVLATLQRLKAQFERAGG